MMPWKLILTTAAEILTGIGLFAFGGGYLISRVKGGSKQEKAESTDLISSSDQIKEFYKNQNDDLKEINRVLGVKVETLTREVGEIRGQLTAESKQKTEYLAILQNRDPETKKFMEMMLTFVDKQNETNLEISRILGEIHSMSKDEHDRDFKISATVTKTV